jgi:type VI secretion system protein ImpG
MTSRLKDYFVQELEALRKQSVDFGRDHPRAARALAMSSEGRSRDPQVELLLESFAYLSARLQQQVEQDAALLPNAMLAELYPHLEAPVPTMMVAEIGVKSDGANFANGASLARGRYFSAQARSETDLPLDCRFRTCFDTPLWPLEIQEIALTPINHYPELSSDNNVHSVLRVRIKNLSKEPLQDFQLDRLRFFIDGEDKLAGALYDLFALDFLSLSIRIDNQAKLVETPPDCLRWMGFSDDEAALRQGYGSHPGYRVLQEYFAFPEKFMFFEVGGLKLQGAIDRFELLFALSATPRKELSFARSSLRLNCVPLVNLFSHRLTPFPLDHHHYEYRLVADQPHHRFHEIYALEELTSVRPNSSPRPLYPCFSLDDFTLIEQQDYFYVTRRVPSQLSSVPGTEMYVSFLDPEFSPSRPSEEVIGGRVLCTNRRLAEQLQIGDSLVLEGPGAVRDCRIISKPSPHQTPQLLGNKPWALVSQLSLNHLSLNHDGRGLEALKTILRLHIGRTGSLGWKQIDSLIGLHCRPVTRHRGSDGWRGFVPCWHIHLTIDNKRFGSGNPVLFAEVLRRFLALYANLNTLVEVSLETLDKKGTVKKWPALAGAHPTL